MALRRVWCVVLALCGRLEACEEASQILLFGDSLTEGLLGNACFRRAHVAGDGLGACFRPYALRVAERYEAEKGARVSLEFLTTPPAAVPSGAKPAAGACDAAHPLGVHLVEAGISGERVDHMVPRLRDLLAGREACFDAVVVLAGTNNLASDGADFIADHLRELRRAVARACPDAAVLSVTLPELIKDHWPGPTATRKAVNDGLPKRRAVDLDAITCRTCPDAEQSGGDRDALWNPDGIHFSEAGYAAFGDAVFDALQAALATRHRRRRHRRARSRRRP